MSRARRNRDLWYAGVLAVVVPVVNVLWQAQLGYWRSLHNRIVSTLVDDRWNRDLAAPPPELHDE
jgi:hypothetical protein